MELDVWVPEYNLALEYQGEHHYYSLHNAHTTGSHVERDMRKQIVCAQNGITLAIIPFWWNGSKESLVSTLHGLRPELLPKINSPPIPIKPPNTTKSHSKLQT